MAVPGAEAAEDLVALAGIVEERQGGDLVERVGAVDCLVDLSVAGACAYPVVPDGLVAGCFECAAAESGHDDGSGFLGQLAGAREGASVVEVADNGVIVLLQLDGRVFPADDFPHGGGNLESPDGFGKPVVVGEHDDLAAPGDL